MNACVPDNEYPVLSDTVVIVPPVIAKPERLVRVVTVSAKPPVIVLEAYVQTSAGDIPPTAAVARSSPAEGAA